jgi:electron transport complex protein RnfD
MATDYVTTPLSKLGKVVFCIGCGVLTFAIRTGFLGGYPEGVSISILFMNLLTPLIEKWTNPRTLGGVR